MKRNRLFRFCLIILSLILLMPFSYGCNGDGFVPVCSITFTTNGEQKTFRSKAERCDVESITQGEYSAGISTGKEMTSSDWCSRVLDRMHSVPKHYEKGSNAVIAQEGEEIEKTILYEKTASTLFSGYYYSRHTHYNLITYKYILVKIIDSDVLCIKEMSVETTYVVSSYSITYFNNYDR